MAFPYETAFPATLYNDDGTVYRQMPGMSLRDWFAGQALTGLIGEGTLSEAQDRGADFAEFVAGASYRIADAMLAARNSNPEEAA